jgi:GT2 family glycosyltransferase
MITTRNRRDDLLRTCAALEALNPKPAEVLIALDGCTDGSEEALRSAYPRLHLIVNAESQGSIANRDRMMREAASAIVLSLDDDSYPVEADFIAKVLQLFQSSPRLAVAWFPQRTDEFPKTLEQTDFGPPELSGSYSSAGAAIRRSTFLELGGYPLFFGHAYEEPDFALRCVAAGYQVRLETGVTIRHHYTQVQRNELRTHHFHARNELWSILLRCPFPQLFAVAPFRIARQFGYACHRGLHWALHEPQWWLRSLTGLGRCWRERKPLPWRSYLEWMRLLRRPITSESEWLARFPSPAP